MTETTALTVVSSDTNTDPTPATYKPLVDAFEFFNTRLFESRLPPCLLTLRNYGRAFGYFSPERFGTSDGKRTDEIAINPKHILNSTTQRVLSTEAHEMAHSCQYHFGHPSRGGYHNKEWGQIMKTIGLYPSSTGHPGGKETGQSVSHYIIPGAPFAVACAELINTGFQLRWGDLAAVKERKPDNSKLKFTCPSCGLENVWGKSSTLVDCHICKVLLVCASSGLKTDDFVSDDAKAAA